MSESPKRRGCLLLGIVALCVVILFRLDIGSRGSRISTARHQWRTVSNGRQILTALRQYAANNKSAYPDVIHVEAGSANQVFRCLFQEGILTDERIFGSPVSPFQPDNDIGAPPSYENALKPGECHWMILKGQSDASHPKTPILIENALGSSWPPRWDTSRPRSAKWAGSDTISKRGRSWMGLFVLVIRNDGSFNLENLRPDGTLDWHSANNLGSDGESWIDKLTPEEVANLCYWDIEDK